MAAHRVREWFQNGTNADAKGVKKAYHSGIKL